MRRSAVQALGMESLNAAGGSLARSTASLGSMDLGGPQGGPEAARPFTAGLFTRALEASVGQAGKDRQETSKGATLDVGQVWVSLYRKLRIASVALAGRLSPATCCAYLSRICPVSG
jgi:hypothetical protein